MKTFHIEIVTPDGLEYEGEIVRKLEKLPIPLWKQMNVLLYDIGKFMLETYGLYEG